MEKINGNDLYQMFNYGTNFVIEKRKLLNDINVFPVADGDTGNNLMHTMQTIGRETKVDRSFSKTLRSISDASLIGARGNSGIIFAQFVNGLNEVSPNKDEVSIEEFTKMSLNSVKAVYSSLSNPVEGTMLSVIKAWSSGLEEALTKAESISEYFEHAFKHAEVSLKHTMEQLAVLKKNNVVDSGALGFVLFLKGINSYFNNEELIQLEYEELEVDFHHDFDELITFRYCTEGLVRYNKNVTESEIRNSLKDLGDSLIIVMGKDMFKVHIHTNSPHLVFKILNNFGLIINQKVDDMIQDIAFKNSQKNTVIVTDSIADLSLEFIKKNDIAVIPTHVVIDGVSYYDKVTINNEILFDLIDRGVEYPTTATPTIKYLNDLFSKLLLTYKNIIVISVAKELSSTFNVIKTEVDKLVAQGKNVHLIDSYNNSVSQGLLVMKAAEMLKNNKDVNTIVEKIKDLREKTEILVCLNSFKYATLSGRLPKTVGKIGMFLKIRPIMTLGKHGKGAAFGFAFSQKGLTKKIVRYVKKDLKKHGIESYALIHCLNEELLKEYIEIFTDIIGYPPAYLSDVSSSTAIHSGKGTVAIGYIKKGVEVNV